jgi:hypothetical protein
VADCVSKPAGTGPPAGPLEFPAVVVGASAVGAAVVGAAVVGAAVVGAAVVGAVVGAVVVLGAAVVGAAFWPPDPPQPAPTRATTLSKTIHLTCRGMTEIYPAAAVGSAALRSWASEPGDGRKDLAADGLELTEAADVFHAAVSHADPEVGQRAQVIDGLGQVLVAFADVETVDRRQKRAGLRTYTLVGVGSAL